MVVLFGSRNKTFQIIITPPSGSFCFWRVFFIQQHIHKQIIKVFNDKESVSHYKIIPTKKSDYLFGICVFHMLFNINTTALTTTFCFFYYLSTCYDVLINKP